MTSLLTTEIKFSREDRERIDKLTEAVKNFNITKEEIIKIVQNEVDSTRVKVNRNPILREPKYFYISSIYGTEFKRPIGDFKIDWHVFDDDECINENVKLVECDRFCLIVNPIGTVRILTFE